MWNLRNVDLNLLMTLDALLRERSVTRAGQRLSLSQPAISARLAALRELFNDELLVRVGHHLELTALGNELTGPVRACMEQVQSIFARQPAFDPSSAERIFTIAATDYISYMMMPRLLERLRDTAPRVSVRFTQAIPQAMDLLSNDAIDLAIMVSALVTNMPNEALLSDRWICATWRGNERVNGSLTKAEYSALPHLVTFMRPQPDIYSTADDAMYKLNVEREVIGATGSFLLAPFMLRGTHAVVFLQERFARLVQEAADIKVLQTPFELPPIEHYLIWNPRHENDPSVQWMRRLLRDIARDL